MKSLARFFVRPPVPDHRQLRRASVVRWPQPLMAGILLAGSWSMAAAALAVQPVQWVHTTEADYNPGETENTVITNLGDLKLASATAIIGEIPEKASIIYDLQQVGDGHLYLAAGPEAKLLRRRDEKIDEVLSLEGEQIFALDLYEERLLVGISGTPSRIAILNNDDKLEPLIELKGIRYIWDMIVAGKVIYMATGTEGRLLKVDLSKPVPEASTSDGKEQDPQDKQADGGETETEGAGDVDRPAAGDMPENPRVTTLLDSAQANLLCIQRDGKGRLYVGSDTDGLIYRVTAKDDGAIETFVLYDAPEPEVGTVLVLPDGTVYAGTADANQARSGRMAAAAKMQTGRPETEKQQKPAGPPKPDPAPGGAAKVTDAPALSEPAPENGREQKTANTPNAQIPAEHADTDKPAGNEQAESTANGKTPTPEQYDQLREEIGQQLHRARTTGQFQAMPSTPRTSRRPAVMPKSKANRKKPAKRMGGNAIYRISPDLFVSEVFRETVMILKIIEDRGDLLVATGNEGQIYRVDPDAEETTILVDLEPNQIPAMIRTDGHILLGTANPATLVQLETGYARDGTYTSPVMDAQHVSQWGKLRLTGQINTGTSITVEVHTGNVEDPNQAAWSDWSKPTMLEHDPTARPMVPLELPINSPSARFLQYRLTLKGEFKQTPVIDKVEIAYALPNLKPIINAIQTTYPGEVGAKSSARTSRPASGKTAAGGEPKHESTLKITWKATDPNRDRLEYLLEYQPAGLDKWLLLKEDLSGTTHAWPTQQVPDGWYILRVTASDAPDNTTDQARAATRRSDPVLVDNTPPRLDRRPDIKVGKTEVTLSLTAHDDWSPIKAVHWAVDSSDDWQPARPDDGIYDSTSEQVLIKIAELVPGPHIITLRLTDARNNAFHKAQFVEVDEN